MPDGDGGFANIDVQNNQLAHKSAQFFSAFGHMLLTTRSSGGWNSEYEPGLLQQACKQHEVKAKELYDAFWKAYSDRYTPASGVEWRHLWSQIEEMRKGRDRTLYSWEEMINIVDKENISTEHFERMEEAVRKAKENNPNVGQKEMRVWRRK